MHLKAAIFDLLTNLSDQQLPKLLKGLELGDKKPVQFLMRMRTLAETATDGARPRTNEVAES